MLLGTPAADRVSQSNQEAGEKNVSKSRLERDIAATAVIVHGRPKSDFVKKLLEIGFAEIIVIHDCGTVLPLGDQRVHRLSSGEGFQDRAAGLNAALDLIDGLATHVRFVLVLSSKVVLEKIHWATVFSWNFAPNVLAVGAMFQYIDDKGIEVTIFNRDPYELSNDFALYRREAFNRHPSFSRFPREGKEAVAWKRRFEAVRCEGKIYECYFLVPMTE